MIRPRQVVSEGEWLCIIAAAWLVFFAVTRLF